MCSQASESPETQYRYRGLWSPHIKVFLEIIQEEDKHDLLIEVGYRRVCLSVCACMHVVPSVLRVSLLKLCLLDYMIRSL